MTHTILPPPFRLPGSWAFVHPFSLLPDDTRRVACAQRWLPGSASHLAMTLLGPRAQPAQ